MLDQFVDRSTCVSVCARRKHSPMPDPSENVFRQPGVYRVLVAGETLEAVS